MRTNKRIEKIVKKVGDFIGCEYEENFYAEAEEIAEKLTSNLGRRHAGMALDFKWETNHEKSSGMYDYPCTCCYDNAYDLCLYAGDYVVGKVTVVKRYSECELYKVSLEEDEYDNDWEE